jgi:hypothetical protein
MSEYPSEFLLHQYQSRIRCAVGCSGARSARH